jgi:hypothetical protein
MACSKCHHGCGATCPGKCALKRKSGPRAECPAPVEVVLIEEPAREVAVDALLIAPAEEAIDALLGPAKPEPPSAKTPLAAPHFALPRGSASPAAWELEHDYATVVGHDEVQALIQACAAEAPRRVSGEQFMALAGKLMAVEAPLDKLAPVAQRMWSKLGVNHSQQRPGQISAPIGRVIMRAVCSLARRGQTIQAVRQADDGVQIEAELPSDVFSLKGELVVAIRRAAGAETSGCEVLLATNIGGQLFDFGKSARHLDALLADLDRDPEVAPSRAATVASSLFNSPLRTVRLTK